MPNIRMTQIVTTILLLTLGLTSYGQKISVDTLFIHRTEKFTNIQNEKLNFPVIKTGNLQVDKAINTDLKNRFTNNEYPDLSTDSTLLKWSSGIIYLDFEVTYIKNGPISLNISTEGCGAYCMSWTDYFTYNYITGQFLTIDQIIDTTGNFKSAIILKTNGNSSGSLYVYQNKSGIYWSGFVSGNTDFDLTKKEDIKEVHQNYASFVIKHSYDLYNYT